MHVTPPREPPSIEEVTQELEKMSTPTKSDEHDTNRQRFSPQDMHFVKLVPPTMEKTPPRPASAVRQITKRMDEMATPSKDTSTVKTSTEELKHEMDLQMKLHLEHEDHLLFYRVKYKKRCSIINFFI